MVSLFFCFLLSFQPISCFLVPTTVDIHGDALVNIRKYGFTQV